jgi:hypothetical protein
VTTFIPGKPPAFPLPLGRYLPPVPDGVVTAWLSERAPAGSWVLEPFGAGPRQVVEAARAGYRVLVASNNPIDRFLIELAANPPSEVELRSSLADLGALMKGDQRLEPHLRGLYLTPCSHCQEEVSAEAFIWERGASLPQARIYQCPACGESGEFPITPADERILEQLPSPQLHRSRALERVAPVDDPDRALVEEALDAYLPRAIYALFTLINKRENLPPTRRRAISALLLAVFDQANALWAHPTQRARPRQLSVPPRFRENNIWLAMEAGIQAWSQALPARSERLPVTIWPDQPPESGGICLYEGRLRDLAEAWPDPEKAPQAQPPLQIQAVVSVLPRPNQAYWTLSALWAGWLWGREAASAYKFVLRRRRYDWNWHAMALQAGFSSLSRMLSPGTPILGVVGEAEPGFISAASLAAALAGLQWGGIALRQPDEQALFEWCKPASPGTIAPPGESGRLATQIRDLSQKAGLEFLRQRGEPTSYLHLQAACLAALLESGLIQREASASKPAEELSAAEMLSQVGNSFQQAFSFRNGFIRYQGSPNNLDSGYWWLRETHAPGTEFSPEERHSRLDMITPSTEIAPALADRVEIEVVRRLLKPTPPTWLDMEKHLANLFNGLETPDSGLVQACLESYAEPELSPPESTGSSTSGRDANLAIARNAAWKLHLQEQPRLRKADLQEAARLLEQLGRRLAFTVTISDADRRRVQWLDSKQQLQYAFFLTASAVIGKVILENRLPAEKCWLVYPGGRAALIQIKLRRDPRLVSFVDLGWRFIKFRHLRRLAANEQLSLENLETQLALDPMANQDSQITFI